MCRKTICECLAGVDLYIAVLLRFTLKKTIYAKKNAIYAKKKKRKKKKYYAKKKKIRFTLKKCDLR